MRSRSLSQHYTNGLPPGGKAAFPAAGKPGFIDARFSLRTLAPMSDARGVDGKPGEADPGGEGDGRVAQLLSDARPLGRLYLATLRLLAKLRPNPRQTFFVWAALVGILGAGAALLFKEAALLLQLLLTGSRGDLMATFQALAPWQRLLVPVVGGLLAGALLRFGVRYASRGTTDYMEAVSLGDGVVPIRSSLARSGAALASVASGAAIGREGPLVQLSALAASIMARLRQMSPARRRLLVACGAAAGVSAANHTPLGGALFVADIVLGSLAMESLGPLLIASVAAVLVVRAVEGPEPLYRYAEFTVGSAWDMVLYALLGVLCGVAAFLWMKGLQRGRRMFALLPVPLIGRLALGGLVFGLLAMWLPEVAGNGGGGIRAILSGDYVWGWVALLLVGRAVATMVVFGSGAVGGVFTPSLLVGACTGLLFATLAAAILPGATIDAGGFALVGMGAFLGGAALAPMTAIVMLFEMTLHHEIVLPLIVSCVASYFTARSLGVEGLYAESLRAGPRSVFDRSLATISAGEIMRLHAGSVLPKAGFREVAGKLLRSSEPQVWVVDEHGLLMGAVLLDEVKPYLRRPDLVDSVIAADIVDEAIPRVPNDEDLPAALHYFVGVSYDNLPVVDRQTGKFLGALGRADLLLTIAEVARREGTRSE